ncbi:MAG TPA: acyl-ACP thioesterase domain-containing protein [Acidimicrobiales bacterium]|nr:acyl-ACP thioesterase domain-containing protein [Acidimicrobiales bacterium]
MSEPEAGHDGADPVALCEFVAQGEGRSFTGTHTVRLGDVLPSGGARLDALARWLQDVAADDVRDAGIEGEAVWVTRRTALQLRHRPRYNRPVQLVTWCSGTGAAWAERRTTIIGDDGIAVEAAALWVCLHPERMRPMPIAPRLLSLWGAQAGSRAVRSKLGHPDPPPGGTVDRSVPLRLADLDMIGHVNNAIAWAVFEEEVVRAVPGAEVIEAEVEYRAAIESESDIIVRTAVDGRTVSCWLVDQSGASQASARVRLRRSQP